MIHILIYTKSKELSVLNIDIIAIQHQVIVDNYRQKFTKRSVIIILIIINNKNNNI